GEGRRPRRGLGHRRTMYTRRPRLTSPPAPRIMKLKVVFKFMRASVLTPCLVAAAFVACVGAALPVASDADAARGRDRYPGLPAADLGHARKLSLGRCGACHQPVHPEAVAPDEWHGHVAEMKVRAHISDEDAASIERYLVTMSSSIRSAAR